MKKAILAILLVASLSVTHSQISFSVPIGYSSEKAPIIGSNLQWNIGHLIVAGGFDSHVSKNIMKGDLFWARFGGSFTLSELNTLEVTTGAGTYRRSSDVKSLNEGVGVFAVYYVHQMANRPEGSLFAGITTTNQFSFVSFGLRFTFRRGEKTGCPSTW